MPSEHKFKIVGIGPGERGLRTIAAEQAIQDADFVVGYRPYLSMICDLLDGKNVVASGMGKEVDRVRAAVGLLEEGSTALVSSGDPNVYGMAGLGLELAPNPAEVEIVPGVTSFSAAACRSGLAFRQCVAVISLSDLLTPWREIESRLRIAAELQMPVALYNPRSKRRDWQLIRALDISGMRDALVAKNVGRENQEIFWTTTQKLIEDESLRERIDMTTLVIITGKGTFKGEACPAAEVNVVGSGPGERTQLTLEAEGILKSSTKIFGAERYLDLIGDLSVGEKVAHSGPCAKKMTARFCEALAAARAGQKTAILTGGDPSIFSSGWRIMDQARGFVPVHVSAGVSAFSSVAARAGAPLVNDFALLSEPGDPTAVSILAGSGFGVVAYNVLGHEVAPLLQEIDPDRPCVLARDVMRDGEIMMTLTAEDLMAARPSGFRFTLLIASANSYIKDGRIIAKRGYETKYSY
ncbi:MAG: Uroporphyrinogen-III C-methyltransferase [Methanosaeta sp. PtaB.Bin018]|nr:MAG: Uroporphyrinogen-III C-methyltransferase [Methanosaeta sp. PtaB.Bin018]OPY47958.1 MAG: Uroporphyrinogen-III C-methyltransferase [Methanosaeta sp. PtaU1.Bin016]